MADIYTDNDIQNAVKRVNQMRQKADFYVNDDIKTGSQPKKEIQKTEKKILPTEKNQADKTSNPLSFLSGIFGGDKDKMLILGLIILLSREGADQTLLMALLYILL